MSVFFLETPSGTVQLEGDLSAGDIALEVMATLLNDQNPWCRLWVEGQREWLSQWTVMERGDDGCPQWIASSEFDGKASVIDNRRRP